jgi:putative nucleotidyltransferase with HDIG domain
MIDATAGEVGEAVDRFPALPALRESNQHLREAASHPGDVRELVAAVEADPALTVAVLRLANRRPGGGSVMSVRQAVRTLAPGSLTTLADAYPTFDFFGAAERWVPGTERFRVHALSVQRLAARVAESAGRPDVDAIVTAATLHDLGKLVLAARFPSYHERVDPQGTPEQRVRQERQLFGVDHGRLGCELARSWNLPSALCEAIERHHDDRPEGIAALVAVADMLAHFAAGNPIHLERLADVGNWAGLDREELGVILYELPYPLSLRHDPAEQCPLSERELEIVRALREGKVGKQIAFELGLSESTIRSHLHRIYARLDVADRAQAVLTASKRGWL